MKVVFLDIDGVLNSKQWQLDRDETMHTLTYGPRDNWTELAHAVHDIDPDAVSHLNRLLDRTGAVCVLSSSWRLLYPLGKIFRALRERAFTGKLIGATPALDTNRGFEIDDWLKSIPADVSSFVILDDDSDMDPLEEALIQTNWEHGLTDEDVDRAAAILGEKDA